MAREGNLILDSDLHMMEPDDLWARYLVGPHKANPPRFFGGQQQPLAASADDKANTDSIMGMEVQGLAIPAHSMQTGATVSSSELRRRSRARRRGAQAGSRRDERSSISRGWHRPRRLDAHRRDGRRRDLQGGR